MTGDAKHFLVVPLSITCKDILQWLYSEQKSNIEAEKNLDLTLPWSSNFTLK